MTKTRKIAVNVTAIIAAAIAVGGWAIHSTPAVVHAIDARYVHTTDFRIFQQGEHETRVADSLNHETEVRDIRRMLSGLDSSDRCRRSQPRFCR